MTGRGKSLFLFVSNPPGHISGPAVSVPNLARALGLFIPSRVFNVAAGATPFEVAGVEVVPWREHQGLERPAACIFEGLFRPEMWAAARHYRRKKVKYVISPRGSLMRSAIKKNKLKKAAALVGPAGLYLGKASCIHFLSNAEQENSFTFGKPTFTCGNGLISRSIAKSTTKDLSIAFMGRYDIHHKGLDLLIEGVQIAASSMRDAKVKIDLFGSDYRGGRAALERRVYAENLSDLVTVNDPLVGDDKYATLSKYSYFIHSSRYEGQPQAVLEAMSVGCKPLVSTGCNLELEIDQLGGGRFPPSAVGVAHALQQVSRGALPQPSMSCEAYLERFHRWDVLAHQFVSALNELELI